MLKSLFPDLPWSRIEVVGFDLDGTLYDERQFIEQVYIPIADVLAREAGDYQLEDIHTWMLERWVEKGSSYPRIFSEAIGRFAPQAEESVVIAECLGIFRGFKPQISLTDGVSRLLDDVAQRYALFLVTDGQPALQRAKFRSLGLSKWFAEENISISGDHGEGYQKPSVRIIENLQCFALPVQASNVVYFGDREVDRKFAKQCGFLFRQVKLMKGVGA